MDKKIIIIISAFIAVLAVIASGLGLWTELYKGYNTSAVAQLQGNDLVTIVFCVPLLLISAYFAVKGSMRGLLIWTGTLFYFLYVYADLTFMMSYNQLFLAYVAIYSLSLFALAAVLLTLDIKRIKESLAGAPVKVTAYFMIFMGALVALMWLSFIIPPLMSGQRPALLEDYTTLVVQALDLGIVVPLSILTGMLLLKGNAWGYALASIVLIKVTTIGIAVLSMALFMVLSGVEVNAIQNLIFVAMVACSLVLTSAFYGKMKAPAMAQAALA
jgi:hypothetical protein